MSERTCGTCATCRWWQRDGKRYNWEAKSPTDHRICLLTETGEWRLDVANTSLARAWDHEDYAAELWTAPDFGCVQWEAKEAA